MWCGDGEEGCLDPSFLGLRKFVLKSKLSLYDLCRHENQSWRSPPRRVWGCLGIGGVLGKVFGPLLANGSFQKYPHLQLSLVIAEPREWYTEPFLPSPPH